VKEFTEDWYDKFYFSDPKGKKFIRPNGSIEYWGYRNPTGEVGGGDLIIEAWKTVFEPKTLLDVGAGKGQFVAYAREAGIEASGFDWSKYATGDKGRFPRCKAEWLKCHNATKPWPYPDNSFDLVIALDLWEHIYISDLDFAISEMFRVAKKWCFLEIATVDGIKEQGYVLKKGEKIPLVEDGRTWAGHVVVDTEGFWIDRFDHEDCMLRRDMTNYFYGLLSPGYVRNWMLNTVLVLEKI